LKEVYNHYPHIGRVLPAMGYSETQLKDLEETIRRAEPETVVLATPADLTRRIRIDLPTVRVRYDFDVDLSFIMDFLANRGVHPPLP
jgi:predicted GTPase